MVTGRYDDGGPFDALDGDGHKIGSRGAVARPEGSKSEGSAACDRFELVMFDISDGTRRSTAAVWSRSDSPEGVVVGSVIPDQGLVGEVAQCHRRVIREAMIQGNEKHAGFFVKNRGSEAICWKGCAGHNHVGSVIEKCFVGVVPVQMDGSDIGVRLRLLQVFHRLRHDKAAHVTDRELGWGRDSAGVSDSPAGLRKKGFGEWAKNCARFGELCSTRGPVKESNVEFLLESLDVATERRLREVEFGCCATEVLVFGDDSEKPDET